MGPDVAVLRHRELPAPRTIPELPRETSNRRNAPLFLIVALTASLAFNALFLFRPDSMGASLVSQSPHRTQLIVDDFAYVLMSLLSPNEFSLDEYTSRACVRREHVPSNDPSLLRLWDLLGTRYIISLGAMGARMRPLPYPKLEPLRVAMTGSGNRGESFVDPL